jgi:hypothetical protein
MRSVLRWILCSGAAGLLALGGVAAWAQEEGEDSCVEACRDAESQCVTACGEHDDPLECEGRCQDQADDCMRQCGE